MGVCDDPKNPLTHHHARRLVREVRTWAQQFDAPDARALVDAMNDMARLLSWVWTEIDESVLRLKLSEATSTPGHAATLRSEAFFYLNRWLGDGA